MNRSNPPKLALRFFRWYCHPDFAEDLEGDLLERFAIRAEEKGVKSAKWHFLTDVLRLFRPGIIRTIVSTQKLNQLDMYRNYFKVTWRSILKQKLYSIINIGGLSTGLTCFILVCLYIQHELSYDQFYDNSDQIYRVYQRDEGNFYLGTDCHAYTPAGLAPVLREEFPEVTNSTIFKSQGALLSVNDAHYNEQGIYADPYFFDVFHYPLLHGSPQTALDNKQSIILSKSLAVKIFGDEDPMGKSITYRSKESLIVTGVINDLPSNSSLNISFITPIMTSGQFRWDMAKDLWGNNDYYTFFTLADNSSTKALEAKFPSLLDAHPKTRSHPENRKSYLVQPLSELHLENDINFDIGLKGNTKNINIFSIVAIIILLLACVNYMNLAIARSIKRAQEIGLRKVIGANRWQLISQFLGESIFIAFLGLLLALGLTYLLAPIFGDWLGRPIRLNLIENNILIPGLFGLVIFVGILSGSYPSIFMSSVQPVQVLKGKPNGQSSGMNLQHWLIGIQYTISIILIIASIVIYQQFDYIQNKELGYEKDHVLTITVHDWAVRDHIDELKDKWSQDPNILSVTTTSELPTNVTSGTTIHHVDENKTEAFNIYRARVDYNYLDVFGIDLIAGRDFSPDNQSDREDNHIINESAAKALGWTPQEAIGKQVVTHTNKTVIGVVKDFHMHSMHLEIAPLFLMMRNEYFYYIAVKVRPENLQETIAVLEKDVKQHSPYPFEYRFLDDQFNQLYDAETKLGKLFGVFTILAILIASLGLFGLAAFTTGQRTKEIGIRKVLGASVNGIAALLASNFMKLVILGFVFAAPIAWYLMNGWLDSFAYHKNIEPWIIVAAGFLAIIIALITVSSQSIKAALSNPVDSLKNE